MTFCPFCRKVHTVPLVLMYAQFTQTTPDGLDVAKVTELQTLQPCGDFLLCPRVSEACEPSSKFIRLLDCDHSLMTLIAMVLYQWMRSLKLLTLTV